MSVFSTNSQPAALSLSVGLCVGPPRPGGGQSAGRRSAGRASKGEGIAHLAADCFGGGERPSVARSILTIVAISARAGRSFVLWPEEYNEQLGRRLRVPLRVSARAFRAARLVCGRPARAKIRVLRRGEGRRNVLRTCASISTRPLQSVCPPPPGTDQSSGRRRTRRTRQMDAAKDAVRRHCNGFGPENGDKFRGREGKSDI